MADAVAGQSEVRKQLFELDLGSNGGMLAPYSFEELRDWAQTEFGFWSWIESVNPGSYRQVFDQPLQCLRQAREEAQVGINETAQGRNASDRAANARHLISTALVNNGLPHSSSALGQEVEALRRQSPFRALAFLFPQMRQYRQYRFEGTQPPEAWHGFIMGLYRAFGEPPGQDQLRGQRSAFEEFIRRAQGLTAERRSEFDRIENDLTAALQLSQDEEAKRGKEFADLSQHVRTDHAEALEVHKDEMEKLRKRFAEDMSLRAPVDYWKQRQIDHTGWAGKFVKRSGWALAGVAVAVALTTDWAVSSSANKSTPDTWRLAVRGGTSMRTCTSPDGCSWRSVAAPSRCLGARARSWPRPPLPDHSTSHTCQGALRGPFAFLLQRKR